VRRQLGVVVTCLIVDAAIFSTQSRRATKFI
jgi:hypothetical protein